MLRLVSVSISVRRRTALQKLHRLFELNFMEIALRKKSEPAKGVRELKITYIMYSYFLYFSLVSF